VPNLLDQIRDHLTVMVAQHPSEVATVLLVLGIDRPPEAGEYVDEFVNDLLGRGVGRAA
jgi:hypothetical protein